jgi:thioredoxin reductase (NADPH)
LITALEPVAAQYGWRVEEIDIDADPALEVCWDEHVPVLFAGEVEICRHRLDAAAVHAFCAAFPLESSVFPG